MREIKFRGKNIKGEWHYGLLCHDKNKDRDYEWFISNSTGSPYAFGCIESTVGQFTGEKDKNGKEIYEGDKVKRVMLNHAWDEIDNPKVEKFIEEISFVVYHGHGFWIKDESFGWEGEGLWSWGDLEVVGNIHDTLEPIK